MARYGTEHKGGAPTKAERMGLDKRMAEAFAKVSRNKDAEGATKVIEEMWKIALNDDPKNIKRFDALKWITDRYYGKEPKALIIDAEVEHKGVNVKDLLNYVKNEQKED